MQDLTTARFLVGRRTVRRTAPRVAEPWENGGVPLAPPHRDSLLRDLWRVVRAALT